MASAAYDRFIESTKIGFDEWHDGTGYDIDAIAEATPEERGNIETMLLPRCPDDWRAVEALAALGTPRALEAVRACLNAADPVIRVAAARELHENGELTDLGPVLTAALRSGNSSAFSQALDMIGWHKVRTAEPALLRICAGGDGEEACHCAAMLFYLHGLSESAFDWNHRPFFLRFNTTDEAERKTAYIELCRKLGGAAYAGDQ